MILLHYVAVIFLNPIYNFAFICLLIDWALPSTSSLRRGRVHVCILKAWGKI